MASKDERVLLIGLGPLATEPKQKFIAAPSIRSWQFLQAALLKNRAVIITKNLGPDKNTGIKKIHDDGHYVHYSTQEGLSILGEFIKNLCRENTFSCITIIGSTSLSCLLPFIPSDIPLWFDLNGSVLAEGQAKAAVEKDNRILDYFLNLEYQALVHGDIFSSVSTPQKFATIGELALIGRLNSYTNNYSFCHVIPDTYFPQPENTQARVLQKIKLKKEDFIILWSGGFNNWVDEKTLFEGLEKAMQSNPNIHFVATGGRIEGVAHRVFDSFNQRVQNSPYRERFHFEGWVDGSLIPSYYREADIAINIDLPSWETYLGARNRLLGWIHFDLPIITTDLCEFGCELSRHRACYTFQPGSSDSLSQTLLTVAGLPSRERKATAYRAKALFLEHYTVQTIMKAYQKWLDNPQKSPDHDFFSSQAHKFEEYSPLSSNKMKEQKTSKPISRKLKNIWNFFKK